MLGNYIDMRFFANFKNQDKYFHCKANCEASKRGAGGKAAATIVSTTREGADMLLKGDSILDSAADCKANTVGQLGSQTVIS